MAVQFSNISNPTAWGVEWVGGEEGRNSFQLVNPRGTTGLWFGVRPKGESKWLTTEVVLPERFMVSAPRTYREFVDVARRYVED